MLYPTEFIYNGFLTVGKCAYNWKKNKTWLKDFLGDDIHSVIRLQKVTGECYSAKCYFACILILGLTLCYVIGQS